MKNVYDIRKEKNLYYILPEKHTIYPNIKLDNFSIAIIVNLYYADDIDWYLERLYPFMGLVDIYIVSSNPMIWDRVIDSEVKIIKKNNRGRDISALLVACKDVIPQYDYVCFLHDKKPKSEGAYTVKANKEIVQSLWHNTIGSEDYIKNIIGTFCDNPRIGVLTPPEPSGLAVSIWGKSWWCADFAITKKLCEKLMLHCDLNMEYPPITIGTMLWFRPDALKKLFAHNWRYEDFMDEPLPNDGTISHAIERVFAYVAQDAGYDTGTIMTDSYAMKDTILLHESAEKVFEALKDQGIRNFYSLYDGPWIANDFEVFSKKYGKIYLYGNGIVGRRCLSLLRSKAIIPAAFIVSDKTDMSAMMEGIPVICIEDCEYDDNTGIIVSVSAQFTNEIVRTLEEKTMSNYITYEELKNKYVERLYNE